MRTKNTLYMSIREIVQRGGRQRGDRGVVLGADLAVTRAAIRVLSKSAAVNAVHRDPQLALAATTGHSEIDSG